MAWEVEATDEYDAWFMGQTKNHVFRVAFIFYEERKAVLLIGGDKKGKDEKRFYRNLIKQAEETYKAYRK